MKPYIKNLAYSFNHSRITMHKSSSLEKERKAVALKYKLQIMRYYLCITFINTIPVPYTTILYYKGIPYNNK